MVNLGAMAMGESGCPEDHAEAVRWFRKAAERGSGNACVKLGDAYEKGLGVPLSLESAFQWYRRGAELGYAAAQGAVGLAY